MKILITLVFTISCYCALAQDSLSYYNYSRNNITTGGMTVLGSWAIANIGIGAVGWANAKSDENRSFYKVTTITGLANLGAAALGVINAYGSSYGLSKRESLHDQRKIETTFIINLALDVTYIGVGVYVTHRGDTHNYAELKGEGPAIIVQSVFLLLFDGTMYSLQRHNGNGLRRFLEKNPITFNGKSVGLIYTM